jgi:hypothetical protein
VRCSPYALGIRSSALAIKISTVDSGARAGHDLAL